MDETPALPELLSRALVARQPQLEPGSSQALRLFSGFFEGCPDLAVDLYGSTLLVDNYAVTPDTGEPLVQVAEQFYRQALPWLKAGLVKTRYAPQDQRRGKLLFGGPLDDKVQEHGVWYAVDLTLNRDASLYLDTRGLRRWTIDHVQGKRVLNTFAYTGSLGVAAAAGGARQVVQMDKNRRFLDLARRSYALNSLPFNPADFLIGDFFTWVSRLRRRGELFDCVFLDPPFFSITTQGKVDQLREAHRLINKVRPLVADGGWLVTLNNALFVSGKSFMETLKILCVDGYLDIEEIIPVPQDFTGYSGTVITPPPTDPAPFNHPTKIAILRVRRKE